MPVAVQNFGTSETHSLLYTLFKMLGGTTLSITKPYSNITDELLYAILERIQAGGIGGGGDVFTVNPTITGTSFGKYADGSTPAWIGKTAREAILDATTNCLPPVYVLPTATVLSSVPAGYYEIGSNIGLITLSSTYTQNNGGPATATTYYQNGVALPGNTATINSLIAQQSFYANKAYAQGDCINNNCGILDCTGRINAGNVNSNIISFTPFYKRYFGFASSITPSSSTITSLPNDNNGNTSALTLNNITPNSAGEYFLYFTKGAVNSISVNGFPSTAAFTITTYNVTNAQGYTSVYTFVYSNNLQTNTINSIVIN